MTTPGDWLQILDPAVLLCLPQVRHVLFDFDGTISVLREGWESVMVPLMIEKICGETPPSSEIESEVREYVDRSTGILTIEQMGWLVEAVKRHGLAGEPGTAPEYKSLYLKRLLLRVEKRVESLEQGLAGADEWMVSGAVEFIQALHLRGVKLYLASGTDHADVLREAHALGMHRFFNGNIYGALDQNNAHNKSRVMQRILDEHSLGGPELMVVGDGPVEIREAVARGAIAIGVASDEILRQGWNSSKVARLKAAGAHLLIPDFTGWQAFIDLLAQSSDPFNQPRSKA